MGLVGIQITEVKRQGDGKDEECPGQRCQQRRQVHVELVLRQWKPGGGEGPDQADQKDLAPEYRGSADRVRWEYIGDGQESRRQGDHPGVWAPIHASRESSVPDDQPGPPGPDRADVVLAFRG